MTEAGPPRGGRRHDESVILTGRRRLPGRGLVIAVAALWLVFVIALVVVLVSWHTPQLHPISLPG